MSEKNGVFIVLEGADGSGKSTQFRLLSERLRAVGFDVEVFKFPQYEQPSSHFITNYLNGTYGPASSISPYTASLFYALDRYEAAPNIRKALDQGKIVLADRFVGSNMAHQGSKFTNSGEQRGFFIWDDGLEYELLGIPRPNINVFLRVPVEISQRLMHKDNRSSRGYTKETHDEHEKDHEHLRRTIETYDTLCRLFPKDFQAIECTENGKLLSIADVNDKIWAELKSVLPKHPPHAGRDVIVQLDSKPAEEAKEPDETADETPIAASASLFATSKDHKLTINFNKVSLLALNSAQTIESLKLEVKKTEWPDNDRYNYYTQTRLPKKVTRIYKESLEKLANLHKQITAEAKKHKNPELQTAITATTPMAALASGHISGSAEQIQNLILQLQTSQLEEARWFAQQLLVSAQKLNKDFKPSATAADISIQKEQLNDVIAKLISDHLSQNLPANTEAVSLLEARPRNEFDLLVDSIYSYSTSSRTDIMAELENWSYDQKRQALQAAFLQTGSSTLHQAHYLWNVVCDRNSFSELKKLLILSDIQAQPATPRYGYEVPEVIEQAGLDALYIECFDESLSLFSKLQAAGCEDIAPYATLTGHKNRWQFSTNAQTLKPAARSIPLSIEGLIFAMCEKVTEFHPLIGSFLIQSRDGSKKEPKKTPKTQQEAPKNKTVARKKRRARRSKK